MGYSLRQRARVGVGESYASTLLDLAKAFETVPHDCLVAAARKHGYSLRTLRLALAAYRLPRSIGMDGAYSKLIWADRGITAGSGLATTELHLLLLDLMNELRAIIPVAAKLYRSHDLG